MVWDYYFVFLVNRIYTDLDVIRESTINNGHRIRESMTHVE